MNERTSELLHAVARPALYFGLLLIILPLADLATNVWPIRMGDVQWRFGAIGLASGFTLTPLLGVFIAFVAGSLLKLVIFTRVLGILSMVVGVGLVLVEPLFVLDWVQMRASAPPEAVSSMDVGSLKAIAKHLAVAASLGWFGMFGWRRSKRQAGERSRRHTTPIIRAELEKKE